MVQALLRLEYISPTAASKASAAAPAAVDQSAMETKAYVQVSASEPKREGNRLTITAMLDIAEGWHVNANPASLDFLISTSVDVREDSGKAEVKPAYPGARAMTTPLGDIKVYEGKVSIPVGSVAARQNGKPAPAHPRPGLQGHHLPRAFGLDDAVEGKIKNGFPRREAVKLLSLAKKPNDYPLLPFTSLSHRSLGIITKPSPSLAACPLQELEAPLQSFLPALTTP